MTYPRIAGYTYDANILCPTCILPEFVGSIHSFNVETSLDMYAKRFGIDRYNETSFDSDLFPKIVFSIQLDHTEHCGRCGEAIN